MRTSYKTPGVYVEEIRKLPPSIAEVETAIPAFIGYTKSAKLKEDDDLRDIPHRITSIFDYVRFFGSETDGSAHPEPGITVTIDQGITPTDVRATISAQNRSPYLMFYALQAFFANGGGPCYIVSVGNYNDGIINLSDLQRGLGEIEKIDEVTLILFPDSVNLTSPLDYYALQKESLDQCVKLQDRFAVMDVFAHNDIAINDVQVMRDSSLGSEVDVLKYGAIYYPFLETILDYEYSEETVTIVHQGGDGGLNGTMAELKSKDNSFYNQARNAITQIPLLLPPSGPMVGIYAQVDSTRGVWKAPANINVDLAIKPIVKITDETQQDLNVDAVAGKSVNAIRSFTGRGPAIVWGARTLAGNDLEWRYISVRRFFNMAEESIKNATVQFVFEPNDVNTWKRVKSMISNFLTLQWKAGALMGTSPEEAFFVKVGLNETMTELDIFEGRMIVEIGMAVVRPAEFIILKFSHKMLQES